MKTYKNLYPQIYDFGNLYIAFLAAHKVKRDRVAVASFEFDLERNLLKLETELREQTFTLVPTPTFTSTSPSDVWRIRNNPLFAQNLSVPPVLLRNRGSLLE